jgi:CRISPR/Cas system-associated exonuclease Cas4 (RecB family)
MNPSLLELRKKPHTSVSAVREYLMCPRRYFLHYELGTRPDFRSAALALGTAWHEVLAAWLQGSSSSASELEELLRDRIRAGLRGDVPVLFDDEDETEEQFLERAVVMLRAFVGSVPVPARVLGTELPFELSLTHPRTGEVLALPVVGAIDAVVMDGEGRGVLWELKTAKKKWSADQAEHDLQVTLYKKAARELGFDGVGLRVLVTTKGTKPEVQVLDVERVARDEEELVEVFLGVHRAIEAGVDYPSRRWQCRGCAYAGACR